MASSLPARTFHADGGMTCASHGINQCTSARTNVQDWPWGGDPHQAPGQYTASPCEKTIAETAESSRIGPVPRGVRFVQILWAGPGRRRSHPTRTTSYPGGASSVGTAEMPTTPDTRGRVGGRVPFQQRTTVCQPIRHVRFYHSGFIGRPNHKGSSLFAVNVVVQRVVVPKCHGGYSWMPRSKDRTFTCFRNWRSSPGSSTISLPRPHWLASTPRKMCSRPGSPSSPR